VFKNLENLLVDMEKFHSRKASKDNNNSSIKEIIRDNNTTTKDIKKNSVPDKESSGSEAKSSPRSVQIQVPSYGS
jgi:hypothetical protein